MKIFDYHSLKERRFVQFFKNKSLKLRWMMKFAVFFYRFTVNSIFCNLFIIYYFVYSYLSLYKPARKRLLVKPLINYIVANKKDIYVCNIGVHSQTCAVGHRTSVLSHVLTPCIKCIRCVLSRKWCSYRCIYK